MSSRTRTPIVTGTTRRTTMAVRHLAAGCLLLAAPGLAAGQAGNRFELRREIPQGGLVVLRNIIGPVQLQPAPGRTLEVSGVKKEGRHGDPEDVEIRTVELEKGVAICVFYPSDWGSRDRHYGDRHQHRRRESEDPCERERDCCGDTRNDTRVEFTLKVPAGIRLDAKSVTGDVVGSGLRGEVDVASVSGDVRLSGIQAGALEASSVSGEIELLDVQAREVGAETVSGNVTFRGPIDQRGSYDFKTLSGNVVLELPGEP